MYRIHPSFLLWCLEELVEGKVMNEVKVAPATAEWARVALDRMIEITSGRRLGCGLVSFFGVLSFEPLPVRTSPTSPTGLTGEVWST